MRIDRKVIKRKDSLLVAIPAAARDHLGLIGGARVWWHIGAKGRLTLTATGRARGGRPTKGEDCPHCAKLRAELMRIRQAYSVRDVPTYNTAVREGWHHAIEWYGSVADELAVQRETLRDLRVLVRELVTRFPSALPDPARKSTRSGAAAHVHSPDPLPSPEVFEEGGVGAGRPLPGQP